MRSFIILTVTTAFVLCTGTMLCANPNHVGVVRSVSGQAQILRGQASITARINTKILRGDLVKTGRDGKIGLVFEDDTVVSMGSKSQFLIEEFLFKPADKQLSFVARMIQGTASFLSGQIAKLAPEMIRIETPDATIGLRGTHVLVKVDANSKNSN